MPALTRLLGFAVGGATGSNEPSNSQASLLGLKVISARVGYAESPSHVDRVCCYGLLRHPVVNMTSHARLGNSKVGMPGSLSIAFTHTCGHWCNHRILFIPGASLGEHNGSLFCTSMK